jgi:hypothetical protein
LASNGSCGAPSCASKIMPAILSSICIAVVHILLANLS